MIPNYLKPISLKSIVVLIIMLLFSIQIQASPDCPIINRNFAGHPDGTISDSSDTGWSLDDSNVSNSGFFAIKSNRIHAENLGGEGIWYSKVFSSQGYTDFQVAAKIHPEGDMDNTEYAKIYYRIDGGPEILYAESTGNFGTTDFISPFLNGATVQIIVRLYNYDNGAATNGGILTCSSTSIMLSANSNVNDASYSWTGPNSFSSSLQNPIISVPGTYTVQATNATGSASASISITENRGDLESIWEEKFNLNNGTTSDSGTTAWTTENPSYGIFHVQNNLFKIENTGPTQKGIWTSEIIDISDKEDTKISAHLCSTGGMETSGESRDFINLFYKLDNGQKIRFSANSGTIDGNSNTGIAVTSELLSGSSLQIRQVQMDLLPVLKIFLLVNQENIP